jgi:hypothetical protein
LLILHAREISTYAIKSKKSWRGNCQEIQNELKSLNLHFDSDK